MNPGTLGGARLKAVSSRPIPSKQHFLSLLLECPLLIFIVIATRGRLLFLSSLIVFVFLHIPTIHHDGLKTHIRRCSAKGLLRLGETGMKL